MVAMTTGMNKELLLNVAPSLIPLDIFNGRYISLTVQTVA